MCISRGAWVHECGQLVEGPVNPNTDLAFTLSLMGRHG